jgi:predicted PurR-regulated permease PerM
MTEIRGEVARTTLSVIFIGGLIGGSLWILTPFLGALIWAAMIVIATWPLMLRLQALFGGRRGPAVALMTVGLLAILIVPLTWVTQAVVERAGEVPALASRISDARLPAPPSWLGDVPIIGDRALAAWQGAAAAGFGELLHRAAPYMREAAAWFGRQAGSLGMVVVQFLLTVVMCAVLYTGGEAWAAWVRRFSRRLAGERGDRVTVLAGQAVRGVALGVVVTAILQTVLSGIGLAIARVPFTPVLTGIIFVLCIAQLGPLLVLLAATAWVYMHAGAGWGTFMLIWSLVVGLMDNFVRPILIKKGADLPFLLIFAGVVGGLVSFGLIGIFVGPIVLAVAYTLLDDWVAEASPVTEPAERRAAVRPAARDEG